MQADGRRDLELNANSGDDGDLFPGAAAVTKVNDKLGIAPTTRAHNGAATGVSLTRIREVNGLMKLRVKV